MYIKGRPKRRAITKEELLRIDQLLRDFPDLSFEIIAKRMGRATALVQKRNKEMKIRVIPIPTSQNSQKPKVKKRVIPPTNFDKPFL